MFRSRIAQLLLKTNYMLQEEKGEAAARAKLPSLVIFSKVKGECYSHLPAFTCWVAGLDVDYIYAKLRWLKRSHASWKWVAAGLTQST